MSTSTISHSLRSESPVSKSLSPRTRDTARSYCAIGIYLPGETKPSLMSAGGKVVIFDTPEVARNLMPLLGDGRPTHWSPDHEEAFWLPIRPQGVNRACILTDYDVYNLPPGLPVLSEARGREWRRHVIWSAVFSDSGQMTQRPDGSWYNAALED